MSDRDNNIRAGVFIWLALFCVLSVLNSDILYNPPYWDDISGLHNQALWLSRNHFNVWKLWGEPVFWDGGSRIHPYGLVSHFLGLCYLLFEPRTVHMIGHLFNLGWIAAASTVFVMLVGRRRGWLAALLVLGALLSQPLMLGRMAGLGQESPLLALCFISIACFCVRRYRMAFVFAVAGFFVKETAIILLMAYVCLYALLGFWCYWRGRAWRRCLPGLAAYILALALCGIAMRLVDNGAIHGGGLAWHMYFVRLCGHFYYFFPTFIPVVPLMAAGLFLLFLRRKRHPWLREAVCVLLCLIFISGFFAAYAIHAIPIPRYAAVTVFPAAFLLCLCYRRRWLIVFAVVLLAVNVCVNMLGLFPKLPPGAERDGSYLERSREFVTDLRVNQDLCVMLERKFPDRPVVAKWPFVHMLAVPEFGYVRRPHAHILCSGVKLKYAEMGVFDINNPPPGALYLHSPYYFHGAVFPRPERDCILLFFDRSLHGDVILWCHP